MKSSNNRISSIGVLETLQSIGSFSQCDLSTIHSHLRPFSVSKGYRLLNEGNTCQSIYFIDKGCLRQYQITDSGGDLTLNLYIESDWVLDYKSFTSQKPSCSIIEAMEDSDILELTVHDLHKLMKTSDVFFQVARILQYGAETQDNQLENATPMDRYVSLLAQKPQIIQKFPLKFIASYLRMTPETLSRVRKKLAS